MPGRGDFPESGFGGRLKAVREGAGVSQEELARRAGCSTFTVSRLERGAQEPNWPLVLALARALGVSCEAFVGPPAAGRPAPRRGRPRKATAGPTDPRPQRNAPHADDNHTPHFRTRPPPT